MIGIVDYDGEMVACKHCGEVKARTPENFATTSGYKGRKYVMKVCRKCKNSRHADRQRKKREAEPEVDQAMREAVRRHRATGRGYAVCKINTYRSRDRKKGMECDLDPDWYLENITAKPCYSCGETSDTMGADRIDNDLGHIKGNVLPCCADCNRIRAHRFTMEDMRDLIGPAIAKVKARRL